MVGIAQVLETDLLAVCLWTYYLAFLSLSFPNCKMEIIPVLSSKIYWEYEGRDDWHIKDTGKFVIIIISNVLHFQRLCRGAGQGSTSFNAHVLFSGGLGGRKEGT